MNYGSGSQARKKAAEGLSESRKRYREAAERYNESRRQAEQYAAEKQTMARQMNDANSQKLNFERRLESVIELLGVINGSGGAMVSRIGTDVPTAITELNGKADAANASYGSSIRGQSAAADLRESFGCENPERDPKITNAKEELEKEVRRLRTGIEQLEKSMREMDAKMSDLSARINSANADAASSRQDMMRSEYDIDSYRQQLNSLSDDKGSSGGSSSGGSYFNLKF